MKKNVLITGALGNLGKATVEKFINEGYSVIATVSPGKTSELTTMGNIDGYEVDLSDEHATQQTIQKIVAKHKTIDAALLLVGGYAPGSIAETDSRALKKMLTLNFDTTYHIARAIFQQMLSQANGGRIVLVGSRAALNAAEAKHNVAYALAKSLIFSLAEILNAEGAKRNVICSVVVPSIIDTPPNRTAMPKADFSSWVKPEEVADAMVYLTSPNAKALRNTVLKVYGNS